MSIGFVKYLKSVLDTIKNLVDSSEAAGPYSYTDVGGEQAVYEDTATTRRHVRVEMSNRYMTQAGKFIIYRKVDGEHYDIYVTQATTVGAGDDRAFDSEFTTKQPWELTYEEDADEGSDRAIPFNVITQIIE